MTDQTTCPTCGKIIVETMDFLKCKASGMVCAPKMAHADAISDVSRPAFEKEEHYVTHLMARMWAGTEEEALVLETNRLILENARLIREMETSVKDAPHTEQVPASLPPERPDVSPAADPPIADGGFLHKVEVELATVEEDIKKWFRK